MDVHSIVVKYIDYDCMYLIIRFVGDAGIKRGWTKIRDTSL